MGVPYVEILFPIFDVDQPSTLAWFVDGGSNQAYGPGPTEGTVAPNALPHQIGTTTLLRVASVAEQGNATDTSTEIIPPPPPATCATNFEYFSNYAAANGYGLGGIANLPDQYGNTYVTMSGGVAIFSASGSINSFFTGTALATAIDTWYGSPIVQSGWFDSGGFFVQPILEGQYILAMLFAALGSANSAYWYAILEPSPGGDPIMLGAVYNTGLFGPPYLNYMEFVGVCNDQTAADPILIRATAGNGPFGLMLIPSVNDIVGGTYHAGFGSGGFTNPLELPNVFYNPIVSGNFANNLLAATGGSNRNILGGFSLPDNEAGTNVYFYFNHSYMDYSVSTPGLTPVEVTTVIEPAYPDGAMVRIAMGNINYHTEAVAAISGPLGATAGYTIDNSNWINNASVVQIPFTDEYTYVTTNTTGGFDCYGMQPNIFNRGGGKFWVFFYMPGIDDAAANQGNHTLYERIRGFEYMTSTQKATQFMDVTCVLNTDSEIPGDVFAYSDFYQCFTLTQAGDTWTLRINGMLVEEGSTGLYQTIFCTFPTPA